MYVDEIPNRNSPPAILLRESTWQGGKTVKRTLANLSHWPKDRIENLKLLLKGEKLVPAKERFKVLKTKAHGHVEMVLGLIRKLGLETLIASKRCPERELIVATLVQLILHPCSKLACTRLWHTTTLAEELKVEKAVAEDVYAALDWLLARQARIERKLARRHLAEGSYALYDLTSSSYHGRTCPLARFGHNRDGQKDLRCIAYGLLADKEGRPVAVQVYPGNTGDPTTVPDQVQKLRKRFGLGRVVLVGDRGMLTQVQIEALKTYPGLGWISALRSASIQALAADELIEPSLFDRRNLAEITSPDFPGERLIVCFNPLLAEERRRKRKALVDATEQRLDKIVREVSRRTKKPFSAAAIGMKVGKKINRYKMAKHFELTVKDGFFEWRRKDESLERETQLDGIYVVRTSETKRDLSAPDTVRTYKSLSRVERAFRCLKGVDLRVRPIRHRTEAHVRAHIFLSVLAYYVEWHLREALAPVLFEDEELAGERQGRDPVARAEASASAKKKKVKRVTPDGLPVHSLETLIAEMGTRQRSLCRVNGDKGGLTFTEINPATDFQARVNELLGLERQRD